MSFSLADSRLYAPLFGDAETAVIFSDERLVAYWLEVEAALARAQGKQGVIPAETAELITQAGSTFQVDFARLQTGVEQAGLPIIELVRQLRQHIGGEAADYVHWGATTQDIMDTALILQIRAMLNLMEPKLQKLIRNLAQLADGYRHTLMAGRTHSQQALPITFGYKVAGWLAPLLRHRQRLAEMKPRLLVVQFGGAVGTLASLHQAGIEVQEGLAAELGLGILPMPWHTQRDNLAELAGWLSLISGSLAKMAQDIILLAQTEIGEVRETADFARGGSSTMPQKSNPVVSELIIAAARTNASLLAAMHQSLIQEHERATHGWQIEWLNLPPMVALTMTTLNKALFLSENLVIDETQMHQNVEDSHGLMLAEAITFALATTMGRAEAKELVQEACQRVKENGRHLVDMVREKSRVSLDWEALKDETAYLGTADLFINQVLQLAVVEIA